MELKALKLSLLAFGLFAFSQPTSAQESKKPSYDKIFKSYDTNKDGSISFDEYKKDNDIDTVEEIKKMFDRIDSDSNNTISLEELNYWYSLKR
ncbi:hypothetical protein A8C32_07735 [Flavivirga aquatica]|uniref:EF-hand domain-containing protein n=1 Tax=Flavivirga aquatica TaxID=1849968 RepID=A0A1E5SIV7_9FLAO|nr:EF-hand domain-containing protein [Flavivirga aquatica]OEJ99059.1 hypothetical protein A8C32_07735 [Flavivirga aquatica]